MGEGGGGGGSTGLGIIPKKNSFFSASLKGGGDLPAIAFCDQVLKHRLKLF